MVEGRPVHISPVSSTLSYTLGKSLFSAQKQVLNPVLPHPRKVVCSWLFTFGFPSVLSLVPPCASTVLGLFLLLSLSFQTDDGVVWMQCVRHLSQINASSSVCVTSTHAGRISLCRLTATMGKVWFQHLLMPSFTPQLVGMGLCYQFGDSPVPMPAGEEVHRGLVL